MNGTGGGSSGVELAQLAMQRLDAFGDESSVELGAHVGPTPWHFHLVGHAAQVQASSRNKYGAMIPSRDLGERLAGCAGVVGDRELV